jgi:hypothetical protein
VATYGLTSSAGFVVPTLDVITAGIVADLQAAPGFGPNIDTGPAGPLGQLVAIMAARHLRLWTLTGALYDARDPAMASGPLLDALAAITGTTRTAPSSTVIAVTLGFSKAVTLAPGTYVITDPATATTWRNTAALVGAPGASLVCEFMASTTGPTPWTAGVTQVNTPIVGVTLGATSLVQLGAARELDAALNVRRVAELAKGGSSNDDAIAAALVANVPFVTYAHVYSNRTGAVDSLGTPPNSFQAVFYDGPTPVASLDAIAQVLWNEGPAGVTAYGSTSGTATDSNGTTHTVAFTRVAPVAVYVSIQVARDATFPANGLALVQAAVVAKAAAMLTVGKPAVALALESAALSVPGVLDVSSFTLGFSAAPVGAVNLSITALQCAYLPSANVTVT